MSIRSKLKSLILLAFFTITLPGCEALFNNTSNQTSQNSEIVSSSSESNKSNSSVDEVQFNTEWSYDSNEHWHSDKEGKGLKKSEGEHSFDTKTVAPTYVSDGRIIHTCSVCKYTYEEPIPMLVHTYSEEWSHDELNHYHACLDEGFSSLKKDAKPHDFESEKIPATFDTEGKTIYTCKTCGYTYEVRGSKLTHTYGTTWSKNEEGHWHACLDEGYEDLKKDFSKHNFTSITTEPTYENDGYITHLCSDCGYSYSVKNGDKLEHKYAKTLTFDEKGHWHACTDEGYENLKADVEAHDYNVIETPASFDSDGYTTYKCKICGFTYVTENVDKLNHKFSEDFRNDKFGHWHPCEDKGYEDMQGEYELHDYEITKTEPTFEADGEIVYSCSICGYEYFEKNGDKLEHSFDEEWEMDKTHHWHVCLDEGYEDLQGDYALHNFSKVTVPATYEHEGYSTFTCKTCGYQYVAHDKDQLEHVFSEEWSYNEYLHWHYCTDEGFENLKDEENPHEFELTQVAPTYSTEGTDTYTCSVCGYSYVITIPSYYDQSVSALYFSLNEDKTGYIVTGLDRSKNVKNLYIPDTYNDLPVVSVDWYAISYNYLTLLSIGNNVTDFSYSNFWGNGTLETLIVGDSLTYLSFGDNMNNLKTLKLGKSITGFDRYSLIQCSEVLESIEISPENENLKCIDNAIYLEGGTALYACARTVSGDFVIPDGVTAIYDSVFNGCDSITSITVPETVTSINWRSFAYCTSLETITFNNNVSSFGNDIFYECTNLKNINISENNPYLKKVDGIIYNSSMNTIVKVVGYEGDFVMSDDVTWLSDGAFEGCAGLNEVTLSSNLSYVNSYAFRYSGVKKIIFKTSELSLYSSSFYGCTNLESIKSIDGTGGIIYLGDACFYECVNLSDFDLKENFTFSGGNQFYHCEKLPFKTYDNCRYMKLGDNEYALLLDCLDSNITSVTIHDDCQRINSNAFYYFQNLEEVTLPDGLLYIGSYAFYDCYNLKSITIPDSVTTIEYYTFAYCSRLESVTLGNSLTQIANGVFCYCDSLKSITLPESIEYIYDYAFAYSGLESINIPANCRGIYSGLRSTNSLKNIDFDDNNPYLKFENNYLTSYDGTTLYFYLSIHEEECIVIPSSVTSIYYCAFNSNFTTDAIYFESNGNSYIYMDWQNNDSINNCPRYYYSETYQEGYWHYVDDVPTLW